MSTSFGDTPPYQPLTGTGAYGSPVPPRPMGVGDALSWAWERLWANPLVLLVGFGVWSLLTASGTSLQWSSGGEQHAYGAGSSCLIALVAQLFGSIALAVASLATASGRKATWKDFITFPNLGAGILAGILTTVLTTIGFFLLIIPGIILTYLWYFTILVVVDQHTDAVDAMKISWRILADNTGTLVPFALAGAGLYVLGILSLIGWIVTVPLVGLMTAYAYVRVRGYDVAR